MKLESVDHINQNWKGGCFKAAFFDFDGTLSLIREGWQDIMIPYFYEQLKITPKWNIQKQDQIFSQVEEIVAINTGKQTIYQCIELSKLVAKFGGEPYQPLIYKREYLRRLRMHIESRLSMLKNDPNASMKFLVPGSIQMLSLLKQMNFKIFLASGTDEEDVKTEAALLGLNSYFDGIFGAKDDYLSFSKKKCMDMIIRELNISGSELIGFGDGFVEIENTKGVGGFACGIASCETNPFEIDMWKKKRLIDAGADIIVPNFKNSSNLMIYILEGYNA